MEWKDGRVEIEVKNRILEGTEIEFVMPQIKDDFIIKAEKMKFGKISVSILHGGNDKEKAYLKCEREVSKGIFIRQKTQNEGQLGNINK